MRQFGMWVGTFVICTGACLALVETFNLVVDAVKLQPAVVQSSQQAAIESQTESSKTATSSEQEPNEHTATIAPPLARAAERITRKPFGIHVTPKDSPVSPERFSGYHTGTDFEAFPSEQNEDVPVSAICEGKLLRAGTASGYGGYTVQSCTINRQAVTVVYGHLKASSILKKAGESLKAGELFAVLGKGYSSETDGERKHLHLGIVKGTAVNIRGYVSTASALSNWIDYQKIVPTLFTPPFQAFE